MTERSVLETFAGRLDALGADFDRWPEDAASEARGLVARSAEARALHAQAKRLAELVARAAEAPAPNGFAFRVVAEVAAQRSDRLSWLTGSPGRVGLAGASFCVAALALGIALGAVAGPARAANASDLGVGFEVSLADVGL